MYRAIIIKHGNRRVGLIVTFSVQTFFSSYRKRGAIEYGCDYANGTLDRCDSVLCNDFFSSSSFSNLQLFAGSLDVDSSFYCFKAPSYLLF